MGTGVLVPNDHLSMMLKKRVASNVENATKLLFFGNFFR